MTRAVESKSDSSQKSAQAEAPSHTEKSPRLQLVDGPIAPDARIGDRMRAVRLSKGMEIDDVAKHLRLRRDYIEAIESMQVARLPKGFVNPYIRDYARVLGLDTNNAVYWLRLFLKKSPSLRAMEMALPFSVPAL